MATGTSPLRVKYSSNLKSPQFDAGIPGLQDAERHRAFFETTGKNLAQNGGPIELRNQSNP